ncbi:hypothetical protein SKAU_G00308820 [Synaphobranchus kaupii]|uniref:Uncharacterized protein n=1 Tax=Synaphobranchus kaupii TaxID=118154 RepID=A0A9Q1ER99_SYNKA|nr:hypothetical protein SKAU_G00308820 [Synaphobranchus kaupii]
MQDDTSGIQLLGPAHRQGKIPGNRIRLHGTQLRVPPPLPDFVPEQWAGLQVLHWQRLIASFLFTTRYLTGGTGGTGAERLVHLRSVARQAVTTTASSPCRTHGSRSGVFLYRQIHRSNAEDTEDWALTAIVIINAPRSNTPHAAFNSTDFLGTTVRPPTATTLASPLWRSAKRMAPVPQVNHFLPSLTSMGFIPRGWNDIFSAT